MRAVRQPPWFPVSSCQIGHGRGTGTLAAVGVRRMADGAEP